MTLRRLYQWGTRVSKRWEGVTRHFCANVQTFSRAVAKSQSSQIRTIAGAARGKPDSQRRRLQRFVSQEQPLPVFFANWTKTVLQEVRTKEAVLIVDETKLLDKLGVMVVALAVEGRSIALAWRVYRANCGESYPKEGQTQMVIDLLEHIRQAMPREVKVLVLADRGIGTSPDLMRAVMRMGWRFLFRVTKQSKIVLSDGEAVCFYDQVQRPGETYRASGLVFKKRGRIPAHVRVIWRHDAQEPWALVTNDPRLTGEEYAQRMWIEEMFRDFKSHGWNVEKAATMAPERMERLWILLVVAYAWMFFLGCAIVAHGLGTALKKKSDGSFRRQCSLFREGRLAFTGDRPSP